MPELLVDFITSLDGYGAADGWPGFWGLEGTEYLAWLEDQPEADYTVLIGANTYRLMSGLAEEGEPGTEDLAGLSKVVFSSSLSEPLSWPNTRLVSEDPVEAVREMKAGGDTSMRTIGSLTLCRSLLKAGCNCLSTCPGCWPGHRAPPRPTDWSRDDRRHAPARGGVARGVARRPQGAAGEGEGAHPHARPGQRRPASAADGPHRQAVRVRGPGRDGGPARPVRRPPAAGDASLHVDQRHRRRRHRAAPRGRLPELLLRRRRHQQPEAAARSQHHSRGRVAGAVREDRRVPRADGLDVPVVLLLRQRLQLRLPRHPRRPGRAGAAALPHRSRARRGRNTVDGRTVDGEHARRRIAGHQRVPAGR